MSRCLEPTTIAHSLRLLPNLTEEQFQKYATASLLKKLRQGPVNYPKVKLLKRKLLEAAFGTFLQRHFNRESQRAMQFRALLMENADWLSDYALFRTLIEENGHVP